VTLFLVLGGVGLLLLVVSIVLGDLLELLGLDEGLLSGVALGAALAILGLSGVVTTQAGWPGWVTWIVAVLLALVALVLVQLAVRRLTSRESGGHWSPVGLEGVTTERTTPTGGEVRLEGERELERRLAVSPAPVERGVRVRVTAESGPRVEVVPVDAPAGPDPARPADHP